ncbi:MAG: ROK family protein [Propionibacteriaceae bacterium]|nr:ROK family protein [Propionibacteriaceae bacterium]
MAQVPVLEFGGSHVCSALVDFSSGSPRVAHLTHHPLDPDGSREEIATPMLNAALAVPKTRGLAWGISAPGPFDYRNGVALYADKLESVGKFAALQGWDMRAALAEVLDSPASLTFVNDADAFGLGEFAIGAGAGYDKVIFLTLGTGLGSAFIDRGSLVTEGEGLPANGWVYQLQMDGRPIEDFVSSRALRRGYQQLTGVDSDVREIAAAARAGEPLAARVLNEGMESLGRFLAPLCRVFEADAIVIGGGITKSWDLLLAPVQAGLRQADAALGSLPVLRAASGRQTQLVGTALAVPGTV